MENNLKEVDFFKWCPLCKYSDYPEEDDPCRECLNNPANENSTKPIRFIPGKKGSK